MNKLLIDLNCNTNSMIAETGSIIRLAHNNGEPIYVSFDDSVPDNLRNASIQSLDYVFGLVNEINDYYYYEVVDYDAYVSTKSNIRYTMYEETSSTVKSASAFVKRTAFGNYYATNEVNINTSLNGSSANYINYVLTHELLHVFGFEDVYVSGEAKNTTDYYDNTFLNVSDVYINSGMISPNDYKFLLSAYTPKTAFSNYCNLLDSYEELITDYSIKFYDKIASNCLGEKLDTIVNTNIADKLELCPNDNEKYTLTTNGDDYKLVISVDGVLKEFLSGKIMYIDLCESNKTIAVLTDVNSKYLATTGKFSNSETVHTNLILYNQTGNDMESSYYLAKLSGNQIIKSAI